MDSKTCTKCKIEKLFSEFSPRKEGVLKLNSRCKKCICELNKEYVQKLDSTLLSEKRKEYRTRNKTKNQAIKDTLYSEDNLSTYKICYKCKVEKRRLEFAKEIGSNDGFQRKCKSCGKIEKRDIRSTEKYKIKRKQLYHEDVKRYRKYARDSYHRNTETYKARHREWYRKNSDKAIEYTRKRELLKEKAVPLWANKNKILDIYKEASRISKETGIPHHVDNIYPLRGKKVSGLHVENNLRIIPASENMAKHNKLPEEFYTNEQIPS